MLRISLMTILLLAACESTGDFADLAEPHCLENEASARWLLDNGERQFLVGLNVHNDLLGGCS